jgi:single-strand DNA-binding protein
MEPQVTMTGNLVSDPDHKVTANGSVMIRMRMAASNRRLDAEKQQWVDGRPFYITVVAWRQLADNIALSLKKGDPVVVVGRMVMDEYDDPKGNGKRRDYEIRASAVGPDLSYRSVQVAQPNRGAGSLAPSRVERIGPEPQPPPGVVTPSAA